MQNYSEDEPRQFEEQSIEYSLKQIQNEKPQQNELQQLHFYTAPQQIKQLPTLSIIQFHTHFNTEFNNKNRPKTVGNHFKKYCNQIKDKNPNQRLPEGIIDFMNKTPLGKQSTYGLYDFRKLCQNDEESQTIFYYYTANCLYLDLLHSNRIKDPLEFIQCIDQYAAGSQNPEKFISNDSNLQIQKKKVKHKLKFQRKIQRQENNENE